MDGSRHAPIGPKTSTVKVAIVGAGMAGLAAARVLVDRGVRVVLFDKGRGVGGRCASRGRDLGGFDHGAQRFSARSQRFASLVHGWAAEGHVVPIRAPRDEETWWLPTPSMNALPVRLAAGLEVRSSTRARALVRRDRAWWLGLEGAPDAGPFDVVVLTPPAPQSLALLAPHGVFVDALETIRLAPCWALTLACDASSATALSDAIFTEDDADPVITLLAREGRKPGRAAEGPLVRLVLYASTAFSTEHLERDAEDVARRLVLALQARDGLEALRVRFAHAHRWRFARVSRALGEPCLFDRSRGLGVAGDGLLGPRIEAAWTSGEAIADAITS
ncbi:MAG: NAD(P)-binding protein [Deltaproteobacteria bacterium]|nr:NAD(P)-binding protein [Deltaproteobacteria bacterium]